MTLFIFIICFFSPVVELKKQSSCLVQLVNESDQYVAFKVSLLLPSTLFWLLFFTPILFFLSPRGSWMAECVQSVIIFSCISLGIIILNMQKQMNEMAVSKLTRQEKHIYNLLFYWQVKTTSPKKYCVRPNLGIIKPKERCDFTGIFLSSTYSRLNSIALGMYS